MSALGPPAISVPDLVEAGHRNTVNKIYALVLTNPGIGIQQFRVLFERYRLRTDNHPILNHAATEDELLASFAFWIHALKMMYLECQSSLQSRHFDAFAESNGLLEVYQDIILWPGFFSQDKMFMENVFDGFSLIISLVPIDLVGPRLRPGASGVWTHIWEHKDHYPLWDSKPDDMVEADGDSASDASSGTVMLLQAYQSLYELNQEAAPVSTFIPQTALYIWSTYDGHTSDFLLLDTVLYHLKFMSHLNFETLVHEIDTLLREAIVNTIGMDAFFIKFDSELRHAHSSLNAKLLDTYISLLDLLSTSTIDTMPYLAQHQIMHNTISALMDSGFDKMPSLIDTWNQLLLVLRKSDQYFLRNGIIVTSGEDALAFLSGCLKALIIEKSVPDYQRYAIGRGLVTSMQDYYGIVKAANDMASPPEHITTMLKGLRAGARIQWWPTLVHLRKAKHLDPSHQNLLDLWKGFGAVLDLDTKQERQRHEEEARTRCSWRKCPRRGQTSADGKPNLRKCTGCGEVQYCSRECQSSDWREGGHKARCKRLKN